MARVAVAKELPEGPISLFANAILFILFIPTYSPILWDVSIPGFVIEELDSVQFLHVIIFCFESDSIVVSHSSSTGFLSEDVVSFGKPNQL